VGESNLKLKFNTGVWLRKRQFEYK